jgi:hypothetical protein
MLVIIPELLTLRRPPLPMKVAQTVQWPDCVVFHMQAQFGLLHRAPAAIPKGQNDSVIARCCDR